MASKAFAASRGLLFLLVLGFFVANSLVCYYIVDQHIDANTVQGEALSFFLGERSARVRGNHNHNEEDLPVFAICLLTRDDLPIIPEWIAYHYHALKLRHLVMAVDPLSAADPKPILENFRKHLGDNTTTDDPLIIEEWHEADFMPDYFVRGEYGKAPHMVNNEKGDNKTWEEFYKGLPHFGPRKIRDQTLVNSHRYRQTRFLSRCSEHLRNIYETKANKEGKSTPVWMSTLDSDEYMAVNPWVIQEHPPSDESILRLEQGSVLRWLVNADKQKTEELQKEGKDASNSGNEASNICLQVPRLLFGAVELSPSITAKEKLDSDVTHGFIRKEGSEQSIQLVNNLPRHSNKMETLRWKFHAAANDERNFQQKVVLKLLDIPKDDELFADHVHTVHRPSRKFCQPESDTNANGALLVPSKRSSKGRIRFNSRVEASPVVAFHYIGSEERYFSRPNDFRRSLMRYQQRSNITHARDETGWIDQWLERFVNEVGLETASALLSSYVVDLKDIKQ